MGRAFYDQFKEARDVYHQARQRLGFDVAALCFEGPPEELTKTERCQPALFVTSMAALAAFRVVAPSIKPVGAAGLSLGELTALAAAGVFSLSDGLYLVQARAEAMAECTAQQSGSMLAIIGLEKLAIDEICRQAGVVAANFNAADQIVLSGSVAGIEQAEGLAKAKGAKRAMKLEVAGAFHSPLMQSAATKFSQALAHITLNKPAFPVISNVTARPVEGPEQVRELLVKQIVSPVLWEPSMQWLIGQGVTVCVEFPPARILTGLLRRINPAVKGIAIDRPADFDALSSSLSSPAVSP